MRVRNKICLILLSLLLVSAAHAQWVRSAKSRAFSRSNAVASDNSGNVYTAGVFTCVVTFDAVSFLNNSCGEVLPPVPPAPPDPPQTDGFLTKHDENGNLVWAIQFPGSSGNTLFVNDITVDASGNTYVTGAYNGTLDLIASQFTNPDATTELFVAKILPDGTAGWAISYSVDDLSETAAQKISVTENAVYITGSVRGKFDVGALADSVGNNASFVASFDLSGTPLWAKNFMEINANGSSRGKALEAKGDSIWVFSAFTDTVTIEGSVVEQPGTVGSATAGVICLYDASGAQLNRMLTNTSLIEGIRLHRPDESLYITGRAENITAIGRDTLFDSPGVRAYVSSHSLDMSALTTLRWFVPLTTATTVGLTGTGVDVSTQGNIFASGTFSGTSLSGPATSTPGAGGQNGFMIKLDATGNDLWLQAFGGDGEDALSGVSSRDDAHIFSSGYFNRYIRVAGDEISLSAGSNGFVARIDICPQLIAEMISPDSTYICKRDTILFQVTNDAAYTYQWYKDGTPVADAVDAELEVMQEGVYRAEITGGGCTRLTPLAKLFLNPLPDSVVLTNDPLENCEGDIVNLSGPIGSYTFQWLDAGIPMAETAKDIAIVTDGDYQVVVTDTLGCFILSDTFAIRFHSYPLNTLTPPGSEYTLCSGNSLLLQADNTGPGFTWQWKKDDISIASAAQSDYEVTESGIYHAVIRNAVGCETITEADTVIVQASPLVDLNNEILPEEICDGASLRLVTPFVIGQTYQWLKDGAFIPGAVSNNLDVSQAGEYTVRVNNTLCERYSDDFNLTVNPLPVALITNNMPAEICEGDDYELQAQESADYSYQWLDNTGVLTGEEQPFLQVTKNGNYRLRVTNDFNCQSVSPATSVRVNFKPPASITAKSPTTFCAGGSVELAGNPGTGLTYQWMKNGAVLGDAEQQTLEVSDNGSFQVRVTNSNLCTEVSEPLAVEVIPYPVATITSATGQNIICDRDSLVLMAGSSSEYNFTWLLNEQALQEETSSLHYAKVVGDYRVVASAGNCRDTSSVLRLQVRANPVPVITRNEAFLSIALFGEVRWFRNEEAMANTNLQAIRVTEDGDYRVNVINAEGCSAWSQVVPMCLPLPEIQKLNDVLTVSIPAQQYHWQYGRIPIGGADLRRLTAQQSGDYSVVVVSDDGCTMETEPVTVCIPYPYVEQDMLTGVLYAFPNPATSYQWYFEGTSLPNGTTQVHIPDDPGRYTVEVQDLEGCISTSGTFTLTPVTGIENQLIRSVSFYPNPTQGILSIEKPAGMQKLSLVIVDATGRHVVDLEVVEALHRIDLSGLNAGAYTIVVKTDLQTASWKLIRK